MLYISIQINILRAGSLNLNRKDQVMFRYSKVGLGTTEMEAIFRLRYDVYCMSSNYLSPEGYPDGLEKDQFDLRATHFAAYKVQTEDIGQKIVGTFRLIEPRGYEPFPIQLHFRLPSLAID